jgi:hypothetical protein
MFHISSVFMGCFPCDTRLEAFPPYLGRVSLWRGFFLRRRYAVSLLISMG